jgi:adenylate cyclase
MSANTEQRKLAAIMFTDMVGYSALSQRDDKLALELLEEHRQLLREIFPRFNGTEIKTIGDAFLIEFNSALEAAQCAIEIQRTLAKRNHDVTADRRIELKIGIHIGDVVHRGGDVYGDGVNIASRIEPLAGAGGICVSMDVERQIRNALEARFEKLAPTELKNISVPMELFRIVLPWEKQLPRSTTKPTISPARARWWIWAAAAAVLLLIIGIGWWWTTLPRKSSPARDQPNSIREKSIAVLPFENLSSDKENAYFAEGIQDEILTRLSKVADLKVISRTSTQHYKSAPENLSEIGKQLGVAHIVEGSVQKSGDAVRVNVQLIKAANDSHLWAETFDRKVTDVFSAETEIAKTIADQLRAKVTGHEEEVIAAKPTNVPEAYDAYLRGLSFFVRGGNIPANVLAAQKHLRDAVRLDPKFAIAWALLCRVDANGYISGSMEKTPALREEARRAAETALSLQPQLGEAVYAKAYYQYAVLKDYDTALGYFHQAQQLLPNASQIPEALAYVARRRGKWDQSEAYFQQAERLDPRHAALLEQRALSYTLRRQLAEADRYFAQALALEPDNNVLTMDRAFIAQCEGDLDRARRFLAQVQIKPDNFVGVQTQVRQNILERNPAAAVTFLQQVLAHPDPTIPRGNAEYRVSLGWAQKLAGDEAAARQSYLQARSELEALLKEQPDNGWIMGDLALTYMGLGDKAAAFRFAEQGIAANPMEKDALIGPGQIEALARVAAQMGEPDRAISALEKILQISGGHWILPAPLTPALLRLDPMFDSLRNDPQFQKLCQQPNK